MSDDKDSDKRYQIGENDEDGLTDDIEVLKLGNRVRRKIQTTLRNNLIKEIRYV